MALKMANNNSASTPNGNGPGNFTLHVTNLPLELEKDGVENMFLTYGKVTGMVVFRARNNTNQAYVSFSKYSEAEHAINELNQQLPLMLNVRFKDDHKIEKPVIDLSSPIVDFRYSDNIIDNTPCARKVIDVGKANCTPTFKPKTYTSEDELLYPVPNDTVTFNPYESPGPYRDTNLMYTRGTVHVSKDGRRHISYGRGYTYYNLPEPHYDIATYLQNVYEKREKGIYEYATEEVEDDTGICKMCSSPTPFRCQKCGITFYCSKPCQISDWSKHKLECQPVPPLVKKVPNKSPVQNGHKVESSIKEIEAQSSIQLRRPKTVQPPIQQQQQQQQTVPPKVPLQTPSPSANNQTNDAKFLRDNFRPKLTSPISVNPASTNIPEPISPALSIKDQKSAEIRNDLSKQSSTPNNFKAVATSFPIKQQQSQQRKITTKTMDDDIGFQSHTFLPKDKFVKVKITSAFDDGHYWVQKCDDEEAIQKLFIDLKKYADSTKRVPPEENVKCIIESDGMWFRVNIVSLDKISKIFYLDWGTYDDMVVKEVCLLDGFENRPLFCRRIRLTEDADIRCKGLNIDDELLVKALNVLADGTITVHAQPTKTTQTPPAKKVESTPVIQITEKLSNCSIKQTTPAESSSKSPRELSAYENALDKIKNLPNMIECLKDGESGFILLNKECKGEYSLTLVPGSKIDDYGSLVENMKIVCEQLVKENPHFKPNVSDLVSGLNEDGEWLRGVVIRTTPKIKLAAIDESLVFDPISCTTLPKEFVNINSMGVIGKLLPNTRMPEPRPSDLEFTVDNVSKNSAMITLSSQEVKISGKAIISKWVLTTEEQGILYAPLSSGNEVVLTHVSSQNSLYVRNMEANEKERVHKLDQDVAKYALNRKPLKGPPIIGQIVLAHFVLDENYYRAIVTAVEDKKIIIKYIDFGNDEETNVDRLFELPEELKEQTSGARKIKLKGVPKDVPLTQEAKDYFDQLIIDSATLKCTFTDDPLKDGVILKTERNENVNDTVKAYLKPTWERGVEDNKKVYTFEDLPDTKLGEVGDEVMAVILHYYQDNGNIILGPNDEVAATAIQVELPEIINKYIEKTTDHYIPRNQELCLAKYCDQFYRAICFESNISPNESQVFFIDYGNTEIVAHTDIRLFSEDFTRFPAFGVICSLSPMVPKDKFTDKVSQRIKELAVENEIIKIKIINIDEELSINVDIPDIRVKLIEEGLL